MKRKPSPDVSNFWKTDFKSILKEELEAAFFIASRVIERALYPSSVISVNTTVDAPAVEDDEAESTSSTVSADWAEAVY